jgi:hypothetical protein
MSSAWRSAFEELGKSRSPPGLFVNRTLGSAAVAADAAASRGRPCSLRGALAAAARGALFAARMATVVCVLLLAAALSTMGTLGLRRGSPALEAPQPWWRRAALAPMAVIVRLVLWTLGYLWIEVHGAPAPRSTAPIVVCNHISLVDPLLMVRAKEGRRRGAARR